MKNILELPMYFGHKLNLPDPSKSRRGRPNKHHSPDKETKTKNVERCLQSDMAFSDEK